MPSEPIRSIARTRIVGKSQLRAEAGTSRTRKDRHAHGTGSMSVPIFTSPGRSGFGPQLALSYDSGSGNGPYGFGWHDPLPVVSRTTDKRLPRYDDSDIF